VTLGRRATVLRRSRLTLSSRHQQRGVIAMSRANFRFALQR